ncbi:MAG: LamG-like jellyroll fold domain-containing protein [Pirellulales bacterium]
MFRDQTPWRRLHQILRGPLAQGRTQRRKRPARQRRPQLESLEGRCLLSADQPAFGASPGADDLSSETVAAFTSGLHALADYGDAASLAGDLGRALPLAGHSLGSLAPLGDLVREQLVDVAENYFSTDATPTASELAAALSSVGASAQIVDERFEVAFSLQANENAIVDLDLSDAIAPSGLDVHGTITTAANTSFALSGVLGVDLALLDSPGEAFFVALSTQPTVSTNISASGANAAAQFGLLEVGIDNATVNVSASVSAAPADPNADGRVTASELIEQSSPAAIATTGSSSLAATLPIQAQLGTHDFGASDSPRVTLADANLFDTIAATASAVDFAELSSLANITVDDLTGVLSQVSAWLSDAGASDVLAAAAPFAKDTSLGGLLDFAAGFGAGVLGPATGGNEGGGPAFSSIQQFMALVPAIAAVDFDPATSELTFDLSFDHTLASVAAPLAFDVDLGDLANISTSSTLSLTATVHGESTLGIDLSPLGDGFVLSNSTLLSALNGGAGVLVNVGVTAANPAPQDGQLAGNSVLNLSLGGDAPAIVPVTIAAADTSDNLEAGDLVDNLNDALAAAGLSATVEATLENNGRITLTTVGASIRSLQVTGGAALGFLSAQSGDRGDVRISLRDGTTFTASFDGDSTVGDVLAGLNSASPGAAAFEAMIDGATSNRLLLVDHTTGTLQFAVEAADGSLAPLSLGILGVDSDGDGQIRGDALHGDSLAEHAFLESTMLSGSIDVVAADIDAAANFGFVGVRVENGSATGQISATVRPVDNSGPVPVPRDRISLAEAYETFSGNDPTLGLDLTLGGSADFQLPVVLDGPMPGLSLSGASIDVHVPDVGDLANASLSTTNFGSVLDLSELTLADIIDAVQGVVTYVADIEGLSSVDFELPLLGVNLADFVAFAPRLNAFLDELREVASGNLQGVEEVVEDLLEFADDPNTQPPRDPANPSDDDRDDPAVTLRFDTSVPGAPAVRLELAFTKSAAKDIPLSFDLSTLGIAAVGDLVDVRGDAKLAFEAGATLTLSAGVDLSDPLAPRPFIDDSTGVQFFAKALGNDINFDASVGPLGLFVRSGQAGINDTGAGSNNPATLTFTLAGAGDGRHFFNEDLIGDLTTVVAAQAFASLPLEFPVEGQPLATLQFALTDLRDAPGPSAFPNLSQVQTAIGDAITSVDPADMLLSMAGGWLGASDLLLDAMRGEVLGVPLPLIGDALVDQADFLEQIRDEILATFEQRAAQGVAAIQTELFNLLGLGGIGLLRDKDADGDVDVQDVQVITAGPSDFSSVEFDMLLGREPLVVTLPAGFDLGVPGLNLDVSGGVQLALGFDWHLRLGANTDIGFFIDASRPASSPELAFTLDVTAPNLTAVGNLGFLQVQVTDDPANPSRFSGVIGVDLVDPGGNDDRISLVEMFSGGSVLAPVVDATADVNLKLLTSVAGLDVFPRLRADLSLDWRFNPTDASIGAGAPVIGFENVQMNLGDLIAGFAGNLLGDIQDVLAPVQPVIDVLTTRLPVISDLRGRKTTLIDMARLFGRADVANFVQAVVDVNNLIIGLPQIDGDTWLDLGGFAVDGALAKLSSTSAGSLDPATPDTRPDLFTGGRPDLRGRSDTTQQVGQKGGSNAGKWTNNLAGAKGSFAFPLLTDPSQAFKMLLGQDVTLVTYDLPPLGIDFSYRQFFPIFGPLGAEVAGRLYAIADFAVGYDTVGISRFQSSDNLLDLLAGFYVSDRANADGTGADVAEVRLGGSLTAGAVLEALIARAGVRGGVYAGVNFNLHDDNGDGRVRGDELLRNLQLGPIHIFDVSGAVDARLTAFYEVNLLFFSIRDEYVLANKRLVDFNIPRPSPVPPVLATFANGTLTLNLTESDDNFRIRPGSAAGSVVVESLGYTKSFAGVSRIVGSAGGGNDSIVVDPAVTAAVDLSGGLGNDTLTAGGGPATLRGGDGNDQLSGGAQADQLFGDAGVDSLFGNEGGDLLDGGADNDRLDGGGGNDNLRGGTGNDSLLGGAGDDSADGGDGDDTILGNDGVDTLLGGVGADRIDGGIGGDSILGHAGNDTILGGLGNDTIFAHAGADFIDAGAGDDFVDGGDDADDIYGGAGVDTIRGGAQNDTIRGDAGGDFLYGDAGNDTVYANLDSDGGEATEINTIDAGSGHNLVYGDQGNDVINTGDGNDTILGLGGNDSISSGSGDDSVTTGDGNDTISTGVGDDRVFSLGGNDLITTGSGDDFVSAGAGNDRVDAGDGNDTVYGGTDDDVLIGGAGNDSLIGGTGSDVVWGGAEAFASLHFNLAEPNRFTAPPQFNAATAQFASSYVLPMLITPTIVAGLSVDGTSDDGMDTLTGDDGTDWLFGGGNSDRLFGGVGHDYVDAGAGNDANVSGGAGDDVVRGGKGNDSLRGDAGIDQLYGDEGDDDLRGDAGGPIDSAGQRLWGGPGDDTLHAWSSNVASENTNRAGDELRGEAGDDLLYGAARNDSLLGGTGRDQLYGGDGNDQLWGGGGRDWLEGQNGIDALFGGGDIDLLVLDVRAEYDPMPPGTFEALNGHGDDEPSAAVADDNATDIVLIQGTVNNDIIAVGQDAAGRLQVDHNGRIITAAWRATNAAPLVEQFRVTGLSGNDTIEFVEGASALDLAALTARSNEFVTTIDGGPGIDTLRGSSARDRIDGGNGSDVIFGRGGDDRLFGDQGAGFGSVVDHDVLFAGTGNDDLIGGQGTNALYAWSMDPDSTGDPAQFGVFVRPDGTLSPHNGDSDGDGLNDLNPASPLWSLEETGINRMLGSDRDDSLYGGTGVDFLHGAGGNNTLYNRDGVKLDGLQGEDAWKQYAATIDRVWYVGGSNVDDVISVDFVTEPGVLAGHHLVTRLTNNNGNFSFAAQVRLDFSATDADGNAVWNLNESLADLTALASEDPTARTQALLATQSESTVVSGLLPPEDDFLAIVIDALDGNDRVDVGPTVQRSVWIDGGAGNDRIEIAAGSAILSDQSETSATGRNDHFAAAFSLGSVAESTRFAGLTIDHPTDDDFYSFALVAAPVAGARLTIDSIAATDGMKVSLLNASGNLLVDSVRGDVGIDLAAASLNLVAGTSYVLRVRSNSVPTIYDLRFDLADGQAPAFVDLATPPNIVRRDVLLGGAGRDVLVGGPGEDWIFGGAENDLLSGGLDRGASDLMFGQDGDDTLQLIPDRLPTLTGTGQTFVPTSSDRFDGGEGTDRVLFLGGDLDANGRAVDDHVAIRYDRLLQRYELAAMNWDTANGRFATEEGPTGTRPALSYAFYTTLSTEQTAFDLRGGSDELHADAGYVFAGRPGDAWGLSALDRGYGATINALIVDGGNGSDRIFGGPMDDTIRGGAGDDFLSGGSGNDSILGGTGNDLIFGNTGTPPDRYEAITRGGTTSVNDEFSFAALLATTDVQPGATLTGLSLHEGDRGDWYILPTSNARQFGAAGRSALAVDMLSATTKGGAMLPVTLFAATDSDPTSALSIVPVEQFEGVPQYYVVHVQNPDADAAAQGAYSLEISAAAANSTDVASGAAGPAIASGDPAFRPLFIPLGDINGDGFDDFIGAVNDHRGNVIDVLANPNAPIPSTFAHVYFGSADPAAMAAPAFTLELPAPVREWSLVGSRSYFIAPGDYNGDGRSDIAVMVQDEISPFEFSNFSKNIQGKLYVVEGGPTIGQSGVLDIVSDATFQQTFAQVERQQPASNVGDVTGDNVDDLLVVSPPSGTITGPPPVRVSLWAGVAQTPLELEESVRITGSDDVFFGTVALVAGGGIGDFSGDGTNDFAIVERSGIGTNIYLVYGGTDLAPTGSVQTISGSATAADATLTETSFMNVVRSLKTVSDVNDDGRDDFAIESAAGTLLVPGQGAITGTHSIESLGDVLTVGGVVDFEFDTDVAQADLATAFPGSSLEINGNGGASISAGRLRLTGGNSTSQIFNLGDAASVGDGPFVLETRLGSNPSGGGLNVGVRIGDNDIYFHPNFAGGVFRIEGPGGSGTTNNDMDFIPAQNVLHTLRIEGDGAGNFTVTVVDGSNPKKQFVRQFSNPGNPGGPVALRRFSGSNSGQAFFDGITIRRNDTLVFAAGDVDGDGTEDLGAAASERSPRLVEDGSVLGHQVGRAYFGGSAAYDAWLSDGLSTADLVFEPSRALYASPRAPAPLAFGPGGDIDGDGQSDLGFGELLGNVTNVYFGTDGLGAPAAVLPETFGASTRYGFEIGTPIDQANSTAAPTGLSLGDGDALDVSSAFALEGTVAGDHLSQPSNIGDLNGDGYQDFVVRGEEFSYLLLGPVVLDGVENVSQFSELVLIHSNLGKFNSRPGDVNGDGFDDLAFADPFAVTAHTQVTVFYGRSDLPKVLDAAALDNDYVENVDFVRLNADLSPKIELTIDMLYFNADNLADVVVTGTSGNYWTSNVISGQNFNANQDPGFGLLWVQRDPTDERAVAAAMFGDSVVNALQIERDDTSLAQVVGDVNGDGLEDLLISVPGFMQFGNSQFDIPDIGRSYLVLGRPDIVGTYPNNLIDLAQADEIWQDYSLGGGSIALGDLDLDGYDDFAIARTREGVLADGSLLVFRGSPNFGSTSFRFDTPMSQAEILAANPDTEFVTDVGGSMSTSGGWLRMNGTTVGINEQILYLPDIGATDGPFVFRTRLGTNPGGGNYNVGVRLGVNNILFHPAYSATPGAFRVETDGQPRPANTNMGFTPAANTLYTMEIIGDGRGNFDVAIYNEFNSSQRFTTSFFEPASVGGRIGLRREAATTGESFFDTVSLVALSDVPADLVIHQAEAASLSGTNSIVGAPTATAADLNHDGRPDLVVGQPSVVRNSNVETGLDSRAGNQINVIDQNRRGTVHVYYSIADMLGSGPAELVLTDAGHQRIVGAAETSRLGTLSSTPNVDLNADGIDDLLVGAAGIDGTLAGFATEAGKVYAVYGASTNVALSDSFEQLSNFSLGNGGDYLVAAGNGNTEVFADNAAYTLAPSETEKWYKFTTLGDGMPGNVIRLISTAADSATLGDILAGIATPYSVVADLVDGSGAVLASRQITFDWRSRAAGDYFLRVYRVDPLSTASVALAIETEAPGRGQCGVCPGSDRNRLFGEDGGDTLIGNEEIDHLLGGAGRDTLIGGPLEARDLVAGEDTLRVVTDMADLTNAVPTATDSEIAISDAVLRVAIAEAIGIAVTTAHDGSPLLSRPIRASDLTELAGLNLDALAIGRYDGLELAANLRMLNLSNPSVDLSTLLGDIAADGYWNFDDQTADQSGGNNNGTIAGPTFDADVPQQLGAGMSLRFDGDDYVTFDDVLDAGMENLTVAAWFNKQSTATTEMNILRKGGTTAGTPANTGYWIRFIGGNLEFTVNDGSSHTALIPEPTTDTWHHVAGVFDRQAGELRLYLDGELVATAAATGIGNLDSNIPLAVGAIHRGSFGATSGYFVGLIDDAALWQAPLTSPQVAALADGRLAPPDVGDENVFTQHPHLQYVGLDETGEKDLSRLAPLERLAGASLANNGITDIAPLAGERLIDNEDAGFSFVGEWQENVNPTTGAFEEGYRFLDWTADAAGSFARWRFSDVDAGEYEVLVTWPAASARSSTAQYAVDVDGATTAATVDQTATPNGNMLGGRPWQSITTVTVDEDGSVVDVQLDAAADGIVAADAVRLVAVEPRFPQLTALDLTGNLLDERSLEMYLSALANSGVNVSFTANEHSPRLPELPPVLASGPTTPIVLSATTEVDGDPVFFTATVDPPIVTANVDASLITLASNGFTGTARVTVVAHDGTPSAPLGRTDRREFDYHVDASAIYGRIFDDNNGDGPIGNVVDRDTATRLIFPGSGNAIPQQYGDRVVATSQDGYVYEGGPSGPSTPNVTVAYGPGASDAFYWGSAYGDLTDIVYGRNGIVEITLTADTGHAVALHGFDMAGWPSEDYTIATVEVRDVTTGSVAFVQANVPIAGDGVGPRHTHFEFNPPLASAKLMIRFDASNLGNERQNIGIDNVEFSQFKPGFDGVAVELVNTASSTVVATTYTDANGDYAFTGLDALSTYDVRPVVRLGLVQTYPAGGGQHTHVGQTGGSISAGFDFGLRSALPADSNADGVVDLSDVVNVQAHLGTTSGATLADGDLDGDGDVDRADVALLARNFGRSLASQGAAAEALVVGRATSRIAPEDDSEALAAASSRTARRRAAAAADENAAGELSSLRGRRLRATAIDAAIDLVADEASVARAGRVRRVRR